MVNRVVPNKPRGFRLLFFASTKRFIDSDDPDPPPPPLAGVNALPCGPPGPLERKKEEQHALHVLRTSRANAFALPEAVTLSAPYSILLSPGRSNRRDGARIEASMGDAASHIALVLAGGQGPWGTSLFCLFYFLSVTA